MLKLNELYHMDCMEGMKEFPDGYFDLAIVDPPYGVGSITYAPGTRHKVPGGYADIFNVTMSTIDMNQRGIVKGERLTKVERNDKEVIKGFGDNNVNPSPEYFKELFRVSKNQIIWGGNYFLLPPSRCFVVWRKPISENFNMAMCELAWTSFNRNAKYIEATTVSNAFKKGSRFHPTQKPLKVYEFLLKHFSKQGDKILDTHAGSATSLVAAHNAGLEYVGFEIDKNYYEEAKKRFDEHRKQGQIF